ncbi:MAG: DoxX family protein [Pseudomonadota bacterium]
MTTQNRNVLFAARALMALIFLVAGTRKLLAWGATVGYFNKLGIPLPEIALALTIALEIGGGIALVLGWRLRLVAVAMGAFTLASALIGHAFWAAEPPQFNAQLLSFFKNTAMAGGFLLLAYVAGNQKDLA